MAYEFPLKFPNHESRVIARTAQVNFAVLVVGSVMLAALDVITWRSLVWAIPFAVAGSCVIYLNARWMKGKVLIDVDGISMKSSIGRQSYPWKDIQAVKLTSLGERDRLTR